VRQGAVKPDTLKYAEGKKGGFDPHARIVDMDADGIDAAFLYPSLGLFAGAVADPGLAAAMCRAYNRWLADYCKPYPDRLFGVAMLPMQSVELAIEEMRYAARRSDARRLPAAEPVPRQQDDQRPDVRAVLDDGRRARLFDRLTRARPPRCRPSASTASRPTARRAMISHTMEMMLAAMSVIWGGVVDRHPRLRVAFLESGGGWIAPGSTAWTGISTIWGSTRSAPKMRPSELFRRNCWISFEPVENSIAVLADYTPAQDHVGDRLSASGRLLPGAPQMIRDRIGPLSREASTRCWPAARWGSTPSSNRGRAKSAFLSWPSPPRPEDCHGGILCGLRSKWCRRASREAR
jgi:hypothetical protein